MSDIHSKFIRKVLSSSQLLHSNVYSAAPTFAFLVFLFIFLHQHIHRTTASCTKWRVQLQRNIKLHWLYFNATRLWYIFMSYCKRLLEATETYIENDLPEDEKGFFKGLVYVIALIILISLASLPAVLVYANNFFKHDVPNFLMMWVVEDPWTHHEIGISGHYLERPLRIESLQLKNCPYRSGRSISFDTNLNCKMPLTSRSCSSMTEKKVVTSIEELI